MEAKKYLTMVKVRCSSDYSRRNIRKVVKSMIVMLPTESKKNILRSLGKPPFSDPELSDSYLELVSINLVMQSIKKEGATG